MKRSTTLISTLAAALCLAAPTLQGIVLRRTHTEGAKDVYSVETTMDQTIGLAAVGMGDQEMSIKSTATMTLHTLKVSPETGLADVQLVTSDFKVETGGLASMMGDPTANMPKEVKVAGALDVRNHFTAVPTKPSADTMMTNLLSSAGTATQFFELPEGPVKVGDSWEVVVPKNPATGGKESRLKATLTGERTENGTAVWVVALDGTIAIDLDMTEMLKANPDMAGGAQLGSMKVVGSLVIKAEALLEKAGCRTISVTTEIASKSRTEMPDMGITADMTGVTKSKMVLKK